MASMLLKGVHKRLGLPTINISCSSADATSVVASTGPGSRFIDRQSPRLRDPHRTSTSASTKPPRPSFGSDDTRDSSASSPNSNLQQGHGSKKKKKSSTGQAAASANGPRSSEKSLVSPATSSRFLLNSSRMQSDDLGVDMLGLPPPPPPPSFIDGKDAPLPAWPVQFPEEKEKSTVVQVAGTSSSGSSSASSSSEITTAPVDKDGQDQEEVMKRSSSTRRTQAGQVVVVLRVSLHCKGCAGKVKKHIAKMEGVTSFDIDIASKKVTVVGAVTPLGVLNSVSKVKPAQFWPSPPRTTCPPRASASF